MDKLQKLFKKLKKVEKNAILFDKAGHFHFHDIVERLNSYPDYIIDEFILNYERGVFVEFLSLIKDMQIEKKQPKEQLQVFKNIIPGEYIKFDFEKRMGQNRMIEDIQYAIERNSIFIGEAPPGTGKSLGYLIPIAKNLKDNHKVIISTNTKNLQMQLFFNDCEILRQFIDMPFSVCVIKGISNYLCLYKYENNKNKLNPLMKFALDGFNLLSSSGDLHFLKFNYKLDYNDIVADNEFCLEKDCAYYRQCFFMNVRNKARTADIIFTNHYLSLIDESLSNKFFGKYSIIVFDEAHNLENVITDLFAYKFNFNYIIKMLIYFRNRINNEMKQINRKHKKQDIFAYLSSIIIILNILIDKLEILRLSIKDKLIFDIKTKQTIIDSIFNEQKQEIKDIENNFYKLILKTKESMDYIKNNYKNDKELYHLLRYTNEKTQYFYDAFIVVVNADNEDYAFFYETDKNKNIIFKAVLIETGEVFSDLILKKEIPTFFISATLGISGDFSLFKKQIGISLVNRELIEDVYETSFNWEEQLKIVCINNMGNPNTEDFLHNVCKFIEKIKEYNKRTLVLTTSYDQIAYIKQTIDNKECYFQDRENNYNALLEKYKSNKRGILIGTSRFWEGIDLPGDLVERIIVLKMPFAVPDDPVIKKRNERFSSKGINPFLHYSLPMAILRMKQGIGRLIRKKDDIGIVYILDERIIKKRYGKIVLNSMFVKPQIRTLNDFLTRGEQ